MLDEENNPIACEKQAADVRDGVVVDYTGSTEDGERPESKTGGEAGM